MSFNRRFILFLISFLLLTYSGLAQINSLSGKNLSSIDIDKIPNEEIIAYYAKAKESGLSEESVYRLLADKGLPQEELNKLEARLSSLNLTAIGKPAPLTESPVVKGDKDSRFSNRDANLVPVQPVQGDLAIFGSELFTTNSLVFEPNLRIPTPSGYILGPDDELVLNIFGYSERSYNLTVNEEGNIYIPQVGPIFVNGLSIEEATSKIKSRLAATIYKAISSGQTRVQISLGKIRSIRVTVIGEAKKPGTSTVSSLTTLFNLLYLCGGPSDLGSYRKIELIRGNGIKRIVDLYGFLLRGDQKDNILLQEGDLIRIPYYTTRVLLNGNVKRRGKYELIEGETFDNVLQYSGGFSDDAYKAGITVYQLTEKERKITDITKNQFSSYKPLSSDSIVVGKISDNFENRLIIKGAVQRPGEYELSDNLSVKDLIEKAGGVKGEVYSKRGSISRYNADRTPVQLSFDIDSVLSNSSTILLRKNDEVTLYSIQDFTNGNEISVDGFIKRPGTYKWAENISLQDIILLAGGLTLPGDITNIEIARVLENVNFHEINYQQAQILNIDLSDSSSTRDFKLEPLDKIHFRQKPGFSKSRMVYLVGEVINPGSYTLKMSGDRITDIITRAGGFRPNADTSAIVIRRPTNVNQSIEERERTYSRLLNIKEDSISSSESLRKEIFKDYENISIDLLKALREPGESENMKLEDGDIITIERNTNLVKVSGEVYFPTIIPFKKNQNLKYYLQKSGSFTPSARKKGTLVIYPDGKAKKVKSFLFFKSYPEIVSRSEIFVPKKSADNKSKVSVAEWAIIMSSLAIIANVVIEAGK